MGTIFTASVLAETVAIRNGPGLNYRTLEDKVLYKGTTFFISETELDGSRVWGKMEKGWVCLLNGKSRYIDYRPYEKPKIIAYRSTPEQTISAKDATRAVPETTNTTTPTETAQATNETFQNVFDTIMGSTTNNGQLLKKNMRLFGLPYQFRKEIDIRVDKVSDKIGRKFIENIVTEAPVVTIIPGKPKYLPGTKNKDGWTHAFISAASGNFNELQQLMGDTDAEVRYYDFQNSYTEYMKYVNIMCRTAATFLELTETFDGTPLQSYDWRNYRWSGDNYQSVAGKLFRSASSSVVNGLVNKVAEYGAGAVEAVQNVFGGGGGNKQNEFKYTTTSSSDEEDELTDSILQTANFVQFYADPDMVGSEQGSNSTSESKIKGMFDSGSDILKELAFAANSGGIDATQMQDFIGASGNALADKITSGGGVTEFFKRFLDVGSNIMKGENVIMPEIYNNSGFDRQYQVTVHLKAPYGNRFSYYMDVLVPLFHLLALALPKQTSANTYGAPFIIKAFCEGIFTCNLGIVSSISINKNVSPESWTNDGFPSEVDVTLSIQDLYSDLTMSPQSSPLMFLSNSSLIEYLATTCGLNLIQPQLNTRLKYTIQTIKNAFGDIDQNVLSAVTDSIENIISPWISIS